MASQASKAHRLENTDKAGTETQGTFRENERAGAWTLEDRQSSLLSGAVAGKRSKLWKSLSPGTQSGHP